MLKTKKIVDLPHPVKAVFHKHYLVNGGVDLLDPRHPIFIADTLSSTQHKEVMLRNSNWRANKLGQLELEVDSVTKMELYRTLVDSSNWDCADSQVSAIIDRDGNITTFKVSEAH